VDGKVELCPANSYCVFHKESQSYACECKPKYKKVLPTLDSKTVDYHDNTITNVQGECKYVCEDYCVNGGRCEVNLETNRPRCECPTNFYGDKCEIKSEFMFIASGIGGIVVFVVFMVLLIWMICVRTSTPKSLSSLKKMESIYGAGAPGAANFYYGAPAPYAESIAPSHHSTYAHYYDDDEGWERNVYNETGKEVRPESRSIPQNMGSIYGTKEDLYDRLRRHQYTGSTGRRLESYSSPEGKLYTFNDSIVLICL